MTANVCGFGAKKRARMDLSVCFRYHDEKHVDWAEIARGLWIRVSSQLRK